MKFPIGDFMNDPIQPQCIPSGAKDGLANSLAKKMLFHFAEAKISLFDIAEDLPEKDKLLLALHYYEGLSFGEIGDLMGIAEAEAVKMHTGALAALQTIHRNSF